MINKDMWIPCNEKKPEKSGSYLCYYRDGFGNKGFDVKYWDDSRKDWFVMPKETNPSMAIVAWRALPEPFMQ